MVTTLFQRIKRPVIHINIVVINRKMLTKVMVDALDVTVQDIM